MTYERAVAKHSEILVEFSERIKALRITESCIRSSKLPIHFNPRQNLIDAMSPKT